MFTLDENAYTSRNEPQVESNWMTHTDAGRIEQDIDTQASICVMADEFTTVIGVDGILDAAGWSELHKAICESSTIRLLIHTNATHCHQQGWFDAALAATLACMDDKCVMLSAESHLPCWMWAFGRYTVGVIVSPTCWIGGIADNEAEIFRKYVLKHEPDVAHVADHLASGHRISAEVAEAYGLVDSIVSNPLDVMLSD